MHEELRIIRSYHDTWAVERTRNLRMLDVIQSEILTGGLETESRLEDNQSGAA